MTRPTNIRTATQLFLIGLLAIFAGTANAQEMSGLFRYVTKSRGEVYAARPEGRAIMDSKSTIQLTELIGFIYTKPAPNTIPLYCLRKQNLNAPPNYFLTANPSNLKALTQQDWKFYPQTDGPIGWVSTKGGSGMRGAYVFRQSDVETDFGNRMRFEGKELDLWKTNPTAVVNSNPSFYVWWKEKDVAAPKPSGPGPKPSGPALINFPLSILTPTPTPTPTIIKGIIPKPTPITVFLLPKPPETAGKVDISFRNALYNNGAQKIGVNTQMPYGTPTTPLILSRKDAIVCDQVWCSFNFGFILFRSTNTEDYKTYAILSGGNPQVERNFTTFKKGSKIADLVLPMSIKDGANTLTVTLNPYDTGEINKENNSFSVTVILKP
jgi:hypothetical protein